MFPFEAPLWSRWSMATWRYDCCRYPPPISDLSYRCQWNTCHLKDTELNLSRFRDTNISTNGQLAVWLVVFLIPRIPLWNGLLLRGIPRIPSHQPKPPSKRLAEHLRICLIHAFYMEFGTPNNWKLNQRATWSLSTTGLLFQQPANIRISCIFTNSLDFLPFHWMHPSCL